MRLREISLSETTSYKDASVVGAVEVLLWSYASVIYLLEL